MLVLVACTNKKLLTLITTEHCYWSNYDDKCRHSLSANICQPKMHLTMCTKNIFVGVRYCQKTSTDLVYSFGKHFWHHFGLEYSTQ